MIKVNKNSKSLVLASKSRDRKELLSKLKIPFTSFDSNIDENIKPREKPSSLVKRLSFDKAEKAYKHNKGKFIIGIDTAVYARRMFFSKTDKKTEARNNLIKLSGRRHGVYTGMVFITDNNKIHYSLTKSVVKFRLLDKKDIENYLNLQEWKGRAGSYSIRDNAEMMIKYFSGSYTAIAGLPIEKLYKLLKLYRFT